MNTCSAGFIIKCPSGVLLGHVTGCKHWDVPKGKLDEGEDTLKAAVRELHEETNLTFDGLALQCGPDTHAVTAFFKLGRHPYRKGKDLELFMLVLEKDLDLAHIKCLSMVERPKYSFPELDRFKLVPTDDLKGHLAEALYDWIMLHVQ